MSKITHSIDVSVPLSMAYDQWTQFEEFPAFMEGVEQVVQVDDATVEWSARIAGREVRWRARIVEQVPDERIAWVSLEGARNDGAVTFQPIGPDRTRVHLSIEADPQGPVETIGDALGAVDSRVRGDLDRFRNFVEHRGSPTGAWRGELPKPRPGTVRAAEALEAAREEMAARPGEAMPGAVMPGGDSPVGRPSATQTAAQPTPPGPAGDGADGTADEDKEGTFATGMTPDPTGGLASGEGTFATGMETGEESDADVEGTFATGMETGPAGDENLEGDFARGREETPGLGLAGRPGAEARARERGRQARRVGEPVGVTRGVDRPATRRHQRESAPDDIGR